MGDRKREPSFATELVAELLKLADHCDLMMNRPGVRAISDAIDAVRRVEKRRSARQVRRARRVTLSAADQVNR